MGILRTCPSHVISISFYFETMAWQIENFQQYEHTVLECRGWGGGAGVVYLPEEGKKLNQTLVSRAASLAKHIISTSPNKGSPFG